jgi:SAM-dependent methyltransferase
MLRELIDGIAPSPNRVVKLALGQRVRGNDPAQWNHWCWDLTRHWYESVESGQPDYGVYDQDDYLADVWSCWEESSRETLLKIIPRKSMSPRGVLRDASAGIDTVVDLGCGIGITTAVLTELIPKATVVGTNVPGCAQYQVAERLGTQYGFTMVPTVGEVPNPGRCLVFASEYFEHFYEPVAHLTEVLDALDPVALIINNSFTQPSIGHFPQYRVDGGEVDGEAVSREFNTAIRGRGYTQPVTSLWNHRPAYWKRIWE